MDRDHESDRSPALCLIGLHGLVPFAGLVQEGGKRQSLVRGYWPARWGGRGDQAGCHL
ncbi:MAG: hypothetical protein ACON4T_10730 [Synechococcus sp.]